MWLEPQHEHCCLTGRSSLVLTFPGSHSERGPVQLFPAMHHTMGLLPVAPFQLPRQSYTTISVLFFRSRYFSPSPHRVGCHLGIGIARHGGPLRGLLLSSCTPRSRCRAGEDTSRCFPYRSPCCFGVCRTRQRKKSAFGHQRRVCRRMVPWWLCFVRGFGGLARNAPSSGQFTVSSGSWAGFVSHMCSWAEQCCPLVPSRSDGVKGGGTPSSHTLDLRIVFPLRIVQL